ncbi:MAG: DUF4922 domain-containing protein [Magnetococcales bacterium]|nr:DUF4922 domain-containing protein [Magnetococcales bacterium]
MGDMFGMGAFNQDRYSELWEAVNRRLGDIRGSHGLPGVIDALCAQQFDLGFIQDDLREVLKYRIIHPTDADRYFIVQYNPRRAQRFGGAGRNLPPPGCEAVNGGCFLCRANVRWQQRGIEVGYDIAIDGCGNERHYVIWMNPFPLMDNHVTLATASHRPQSWLRPQGAERDPVGIGPVLHDFLHLVGELPNYVGFYNGEGAGATIPHHFHYQFFRRPEGHGFFPLEAAAQEGVKRGLSRESRPGPVAGYPISAIHLDGERESVIAQATRVIELWEQINADPTALSANLIGTQDPDHAGHFHLYIVPRNKTFSRGPGMVGVIAGLELLGEIVFSTAEEKQYLDRGRVDYHFIERILASVAAPRARDLEKMVAKEFG